jgi:hypothetical protein
LSNKYTYGSYKVVRVDSEKSNLMMSHNGTLKYHLINMDIKDETFKGTLDSSGSQLGPHVEEIFGSTTGVILLE